MKFSLNWLRDHLETHATLKQITDTLTAIGLEVEEVIDHAAPLKDFIVAYIQEASPHPGADKLRICKVDDGTTLRQVVCGAPNARAGINVVLAREGVRIPESGMTIKKTSIRSVESNGMLCSARELGLGEDSSGIIELPANAVPGEPIIAALGLDDPVIDINVTPNRADCLGVFGIARDLAAAGMGRLSMLPMTGFQLSSLRENGNFEVVSAGIPSISVTLETPACPLFIGCRITGVKNALSPDWLQQRLKAIGLRPISALVDITNYMTITYGRPLHAFDAKKITGNVTVRIAKDGETLRALNGKDYTLDSSMIAVCDESGVIGLGGIIGGEKTACDEHTTEVFLEAALFDPQHIARTGRALAIESDARYRFERGVDAGFVKTGIELAAAMVCELCGGNPEAPVVAGEAPSQNGEQIAFHAEKIRTLGGLDVPLEQCKTILTALGFTLTNDYVTAPSWRGDIMGEADIVEEILRIAGYDMIPSVSLPAAQSKPNPQPQHERTGAIRKTLAARGITEVCNWSFISEAQAKLFASHHAPLTLLNPISADMSTMRPNLLAGLLAAVERNSARGFKDIALFEIGAVFENSTPQGQKPSAAGIHSAQAAERSPFHNERETDMFDAKADLLALLASAGLNGGKLPIDRTVPSWYHPQRAGRITLGGKVTLGYFGELHPLVLSAFGIRERVVAFEAFLDAIPLPKAKSKARPLLAVSDFQPVERDFAFVGNVRMQAGDIVKAIEGAEKQLIQSVRIFDVYSGKGVEEGKKSVAVSVTLQAMDRTLTEQEIEDVAGKVIAAALGLGLTLRT